MIDKTKAIEILQFKKRIASINSTNEVQKAYDIAIQAIMSQSKGTVERKML